MITKEEDDPASLAIDIRYFNLSCEKGGYFSKPINECEEKIIDGIKLFVEDNKLFIPYSLRIISYLFLKKLFII